MGCRYSYRGLRAIRNMRRDGTYRRNVLVIGAGEAGNQLIKEINNSRYVKKKVVVEPGTYLPSYVPRSMQLPRSHPVYMPKQHTSFQVPLHNSTDLNIIGVPRR
jgi:glycerate-2-kinase